MSGDKIMKIEAEVMLSDSEMTCNNNASDANFQTIEKDFALIIGSTEKP